MNACRKAILGIFFITGLGLYFHANALPTNQTCKPLDATHLQCISWNPPLESATAGAWSPDYWIKSDAPPGYRLESAKFNLVGPHPCWGDDTHHGSGSWAKCRRTSRDDRNVTWAYSIQGQQGNENWGYNYHVPEQPSGVTYGKAPDGKVTEGAMLTLKYVRADGTKTGVEEDKTDKK